MLKSEKSSRSSAQKNRVTTLALKGLIYMMRAIRPLLGPTQCKFLITCTAYAEDQLYKKQFFIALLYISLRLICCSPFYSLIPLKIRSLVS